MKRRSTPQERKIRDYTNLLKNTYGENSKSSRQALYNRKRWVNRSFRKGVNNIVSELQGDAEELDSHVRSFQRREWKKCADELLIKTLNRKWSGSSRTKAQPNLSRLRSEALHRVRKSKVGTDL